MFSIWKETIEAFDASFDLNSASLSNRILQIFKILSNLTEFHRALTSNRVYVSLYIYINIQFEGLVSVKKKLRETCKVTSFPNPCGLRSEDKESLSGERNR